MNVDDSTIPTLFRLLLCTLIMLLFASLCNRFVMENKYDIKYYNYGTKLPQFKINCWQYLITNVKLKYIFITIISFSPDLTKSPRGGFKGAPGPVHAQGNAWCNATPADISPPPSIPATQNTKGHVNLSLAQVWQIKCWRNSSD